MTKKDQGDTRKWVYPTAILGAVATFWFALLLAADHIFSGRARPLVEALLGYDADDIQAALGGLPEVVVAVLGIAITVVSIVLQLSATRYTPRVTEMFFRDRTNLLILSFFVITSFHCLWTSFAIRKSFVPLTLVLATLLMMTIAILMLIPYFIYVFAFLEPQRVVSRLQDQALQDALGTRASRAHVDKRLSTLAGIEQLADIAINAQSNKDRLIAWRSVDALRELVQQYLPRKQELPMDWFQVEGRLLANPDFAVMAKRSVDELTSDRTWLEFAVLRQYQAIFGDCLNRMRDVNQLVAINTRQIGEAALAQDGRGLVSLVIKFFNTFLRATINARDIRSGYNVLHQYRQLAEVLIGHGRSEEVVAIGEHLKYYGQTANLRGLAFLTETAAYDLCRLCEVAHEAGSTDEHSLLATFLEVDKAPETEAEERSLRGVRKAQIKLATYYLTVNAEALARLIWKDMEHERPERLAGIRNEILAVETEAFWEIIDRGENMEYLSVDRRAQLATFFGWFEGLAG